MDTYSNRCTPNEKDYESLLAFLDREPPLPKKVYGLIEFHTPNREDVPPESPACEPRCWTSEKGVFFQALGKNGTWEFGDPDIQVDGQEFALEPESIWHISRLCSIMKNPPVRTSISTLYGFLLFLRGMEETLPFRWGGYAVEALTEETLGTLVADLGMSMDDRNLYRRLSTELDDADRLRMWRRAFRECLLFTHPEMGLSYAAYMGHGNLFGFKVLLRRDWWWRGKDEGLNSFQLKRQTDEMLQPKEGPLEPVCRNDSEHGD